MEVYFRVYFTFLSGEKGLEDGSYRQAAVSESAERQNKVLLVQCFHGVCLTITNIKYWQYYPLIDCSG